MDFSYEMHTHETVCLSLITSGAIRIRMHGAEFTAREGDLYAIDADVPHAGWPVDEMGWSLRTLYVDRETINAWGGRRGEDTHKPSFRGPIIRDPKLNAMFSGLHLGAEQAIGMLGYEEAAIELGTYFLACHSEDPGPDLRSGRETGGVRIAKDYLRQNLDQKVSLSKLAEIAGLPPFRIYRAFQREAGMTPHEFQRQARIRFATEQIRQGEPLAAIAAAAGFTDQAHFTRSFHKHLAITPGAYRASLSRVAPI